jgi:hypothetical protein
MFHLNRMSKLLLSYRIMGRPRCQCDPKCPNPSLEGSAFCENHQSCTAVSPLSGDETSYDPDQWNGHKGVKEAHNCFAYAYGFMDMPQTPKCTKESCPISFPQPGRASGYPKWSKIKGKRCPDIIARALGDVPGSKRTRFSERCSKGMRKVAFIADPKEDYHVLRQDMTWSHKPGSTEVTNVDASKRPIVNPELANFDYPDSGLNYKHFCGYLCIPATKKHRLRRSGGKRGTRKQSKKRRTRRIRRN